MVGLDAPIPYQRNDLVSLWHQHGVVEQQKFEPEGTHITGRVPRTLMVEFDEFAHSGQPLS
jgi:GTP-binding protein HflX